MAGGIRVRMWMMENLEDHRDPQTDEINMTTLAEDAAREFDMYDGDEPDELLFGWAYQIAERDTARRLGIITPALRGEINRRGSDWF